MKTLKDLIFDVNLKRGNGPLRENHKISLVADEDLDRLLELAENFVKMFEDNQKTEKT